LQYTFLIQKFNEFLPYFFTPFYKSPKKEFFKYIAQWSATNPKYFTKKGCEYNRFLKENILDSCC